MFLRTLLIAECWKGKRKQKRVHFLKSLKIATLLVVCVFWKPALDVGFKYIIGGWVAFHVAPGGRQWAPISVLWVYSQERDLRIAWSITNVSLPVTSYYRKPSSHPNYYFFPSMWKTSELQCGKSGLRSVFFTWNTSLFSEYGWDTNVTEELFILSVGQKFSNSWGAHLISTWNFKGTNCVQRWQQRNQNSWVAASCIFSAVQKR